MTYDDDDNEQSARWTFSRWITQNLTTELKAYNNKSRKENRTILIFPAIENKERVGYFVAYRVVALGHKFWSFHKHEPDSWIRAHTDGKIIVVDTPEQALALAAEAVSLQAEDVVKFDKINNAIVAHMMRRYE